MPLFMDLHKAADYEVKPTVEEIKKNHIADLAVQHKYGVRFLQYWINEEAGMVFCLMEAPDKEACAAVHAEAHGAMPCNVIELQGGDYAAFLNDGKRKNEFDIIENSDGTLDSGYRTILVIDVLSLATKQSIGEEINQVIAHHGGHLLQRPGHRHTVVFASARSAATAAVDIIHGIANRHGSDTEIRMGISAGAPVTDGQQLFDSAIGLANRLCDTARPGQAVVSSLAGTLSAKNGLQQHGAGFLKTLNPDDEAFVNRFIETTAALASADNLHIDKLTKSLGTSRSQLYRRFKNLTGLSPNAFLQEWRLQRAAQLIRVQYGNVTQVALEAGFSNLSYFAKTFRQRFGVSPMQAAKLQAECPAF